MRTRILTLTVLSCLAAPLHAQTCLKAPLPPVPSLFPDVVEGMDRRFYNRMDACYTNIYQPADFVAGESGAWAVVSIEPAPDPDLGRKSSELASHYEAAGTTVHMVDGWPVTFSATGVGDEFIALRGALRVTVVVKDGDHGAVSKALAEVFLRAILADPPCG